MAIEIDLLNSSGNPAHPPIIDVVSILATERLARAGSFSAEISPTDSFVENAAEFGRIDIYAGGALLTEIGSGVIERISNRVNPTSHTTSLSGADALGELAQRRVGDLLLADDGVGDVERFIVHDANSPTSTVYDSFPTASFYQPTGSGYYHYFQNTSFKFSDLQLEASISGTTTGDVVYGTPQVLVSSGWVSVTDFVDGTLSGGNSLQQDGTITFTAPDAWIRGTQDGYDGFSLRIPLTGGGNITGLSIDSVQANTKVALADDVTTVMALAADMGWTVAGASETLATGIPAYAGTAAGSLLQLQDETILEWLVRTAEIHGEWFTAVGRVLYWMRDEYAPGTVVLHGKGVNSQQVYDAGIDGVLVSHEYTNDVRGVGTRMRARGGDGLSLIYADYTLPAGYSWSADHLSIIDDTAEATFGRIDGVATFPEIADVANRVNSANQLAIATIALLQSRNHVHQSFNGEVVGAVPLVGALCIVDTPDLFGEYLCLERTYTRNKDGESWSVLLSNDHTRPRTSAEIQARKIREQQRAMKSADTMQIVATASVETLEHTHEGQYAAAGHDHDANYAPLTHASATNNPHSVTAAQTGALATTGGILTDDLEFSGDSDGVILTDRTTATQYRLYVDSGTLSIEAI